MEQEKNKFTKIIEENKDIVNKCIATLPSKIVTDLGEISTLICKHLSVSLNEKPLILHVMVSHAIVHSITNQLEENVTSFYKTYFELFGQNNEEPKKEDEKVDA